jgi:HD-like signal output (HDOD) protein
MKPLSDWLAELKDWDIPVMRRTISELGKLGKKIDQVTPGEIAEVVLHDPLMTLKILRLVNNLSRSRLSNEITTVEHAVMMMGVGPCFNRLQHLQAIEEVIGVDKALPELMKAFSRARFSGWLARDCAIFRADMKSEEVYIGAQLYDFGWMVLWAYDPELMQKIQEHARRNGVGLDQVAGELLGFEIRDFQFALAETWKLPELMQAFMHSESASKPRVLGVIMAASIARHAESGWYATGLQADYEVIANLLHIPFDEAVAMVHHNAVVVARHWQWYGVPPAATWLPMLPGEWPMEAVEEEMASTEEAAAEAEVCLAPRADVLQKTMAEISAHLDGTLNLHDMMSLVLKGMHEGIGLHRVVFALMTADRSGLKAKYVVGTEPESPLRQLHFDLHSAHLFGRLMEKVQSVWLNAGNRHTLEPLITDEIWQLIGHGEFFAMSVFVHDKPVGLFYADRGRGQCTLDEHSYQEFKKLSLRASEGLAHLSRK